MAGTAPTGPPAWMQAEPDPTVSPALFVREFELGANARRWAAPGSRLGVDVEERMHMAFREKQFRELPWMDKAFSVAWISQTEVAVGTKCNSVVVLDTGTGDIRVVQQPASDNAADSILNRKRPPDGVHMLAVSPLGSFMLGTGQSVTEGVVWSLAHGGVTPVCKIKGHTDTIFGGDWVDERHAITCSRDGSLRMWQLRHDGTATASSSSSPHDEQVHATVVARQDHETRVRDVKNHRATGVVASLGGHSGCVRLWTNDLRLRQEYRLEDPRENLCLAVSDNSPASIAAGSLRQVTLLDPRNDRAIRGLLHHDKMGVRSVGLHGNYLSCGGAAGSINLCDLRMGMWIPGNGNAELMSYTLPKGPAADSALRWLTEPDSCPVAVYSHAWGPGGSVMAVGGPLFLNYKGCYMSMWR